MKVAGGALEPRLKTTGLTVHNLASEVHQEGETEANFYSDIINNSPGNSKQPFSTINQLLSPKPPTHSASTNECCDNFSTFFRNKVQLSASTPAFTPPHHLSASVAPPTTHTLHWSCPSCLTDSHDHISS